MTAVTDSLIFRTILSTPASASIWSDTTRTSYYLRIEAALATVQARLAIVPQRAADEIVKCCDVTLVDWEQLERETVLVGYPVLGVVRQIVGRVNEVEGGLGEWMHWGATTQDITDTATVLQLRDTLVLVEECFDSITESLSDLCETHKTTPVAARSNLQQAIPMSFGFKLARLLATFHRHRTRLAELRARLLVLEFGGAAGTLATIPEVGLRCQEELAKELGLAVPDIAWHIERDRVAEAGAFFALVTGTCAKFALDVKLMMQTEVGEVSEPYVPHRGSSSTMPQKRNPISCAYITAMASTVRQLSAALFDAMVEDHERSTGPWEIEWIVLPQICTLTHATLKQTSELIAGLEVRPAAMQKNLEISKGAIVSEAVMMGLGKTLGRQYAHDLVYDLCHEAAKTGKPLLELLIEHPEVKLSRQELEKLCDPANYLGYSVEMVERVLRLVKQERHNEVHEMRGNTYDV
ncbi:L-Aspartase-like protein [Cryomyces antarcticus]